MAHWIEPQSYHLTIKEISEETLLYPRPKNLFKTNGPHL